MASQGVRPRQSEAVVEVTFGLVMARTGHLPNVRLQVSLAIEQHLGEG